MGYACPVCELPQRDAAHLANHLAITALTHGDEHAAWLDANAPDWTDDDPESLGERVVPHAAETTYDELFEDTVHDRPPDARMPTPADEATREALAEARRLARERRDGND